MNFPDYLLQEPTHHVAVLSQELGGPQQEARADLSAYGVALLRFNEDAMTKKFAMTPEEADAFATAWLVFRGQADRVQTHHHLKAVTT